MNSAHGLITQKMFKECLMIWLKDFEYGLMILLRMICFTPQAEVSSLLPLESSEALKV